MNNIVINVEGIGKQYNIGALRGKQQHDTLRDKIAAGVKSTSKHILHRRKTILGSEKIWALRNISLNIKAGEVLGIIGKNGAGKSTLLKILCRVTSPTEGRVMLKGKVGSLLEVGTGFHQELTGRENIYLSGAILGMDKAYMNAKFDEIVAFSGIDNFIDTPVKRFSSGMLVRLGFAVAAHLEPEILLIDEVLAVGDAEFKEKCIGRIEEIGKEGRTVLYVSHNMNSVKSLCSHAILLESGCIKDRGVPEEIIRKYLKGSEGDQKSIKRISPNIKPGDDSFKLNSLELHQNGEIITGNVMTSEPLEVWIRFTVKIPHNHLQVGFELLSSFGTRILGSYHTDSKNYFTFGSGTHVLKCVIPKCMLNEGCYYIRPQAALYRERWLLYGQEKYDLRFNTILDHLDSPLWQKARNDGVLATKLAWLMEHE